MYLTSTPLGTASNILPIVLTMLSTVRRLQVPKVCPTTTTFSFLCLIFFVILLLDSGRTDFALISRRAAIFY